LQCDGPPEFKHHPSEWFLNSDSFEPNRTSETSKASQRRFGAANEAKKSTQYFSERVSGGGFSRYPVIVALLTFYSVYGNIYVNEFKTNRITK
jgi:hypothetical protein